MKKIKERVLEYLKINNITKQNFCEITGISLWNITGKSLNSEFGGEQICQILVSFPNLNPDWLLLEKGEMLRKKQQNIPNLDPLNMVSLEKYEKKVEECALLRAELNALKASASQYAASKGAYSGTISMEN